VEQTLNHDYRAAVNFLFSFIDYERDQGWKYDNIHFDLKRVRDLFEAIGNPHLHGWFVHIAGTNGKGSVAAMIAKALALGGLSTGLYTSPHLITFRERIRVNGSMMTRDEVIDGVRRLKPVAEQFHDLTFFEVWTALAFDHFARTPVDVSVIEVGMGGRIDTTNVITPAVSVITPVSHDHCGKLGDTLAKIAQEKAGIIKPGVPVVAAPQEPVVMDVIRHKAKETGADLTVVGDDIIYHAADDTLSYSGPLWSLEDVHVPIRGDIQLHNAAVALAALESLAIRGYPVDRDQTRHGVESVKWPGRLQTLSQEPEVIVDGACNAGAMRAVCEYLKTRAATGRTIAVVAMCRDKEISSVLDILGTCASKFILTHVDNPRIMEADELAVNVPDHVETVIEPDHGKALQKASALAGKDGLVIVTGSLYLVGDVLKQYGSEMIEVL